MKYDFETIKYDDNLPAKIEIKNQPGSMCRTEPHWHKEIELIYMLDGQLSVTKNGAEQTLAPDDIFLLNSSEIHKLDVENGDEQVSFLTVHLSFDFAKKFDSALDSVYFRIDKNTNAEENLKELMRQLASCKSTSNQEYPGIKQYAIVMDIFHVLFENCRRQKQISLYGGCSVGFRNAKLAMEYIEEHYREELSLNILAELVGLNPIYFSKYFKDATGKGFTAYVNSVRMKHAVDDLLTHGMSIADAAKYNGFASVKSFENACKRSYGLTPLQFKKQQLSVS